MKITKESKTFKLMTALQAGEALTPSQIKKRFSIGNPYAEVSRLRESGFVVYTNQRKAKNGVKVTEYRHGKASREIVAAGYRALALGV